MPEPRLFTLIRHTDESGVSGTGRVLDGVIFHTGQVVICWRTDVDITQSGYSSIAIYPSWEAFLHIHIRPHPPGAMEIRFGTESAHALKKVFLCIFHHLVRCQFLV
jgi:hypothetical protein